MLKDKVAMVTGASSGIGRAIALVWAREGAKVVVSDVNTVGGEETAALVRAAGGDAIFVAADVGQPADCEALVARTVAHYGRLDIACNNAGIGGPQAPTADYPLDGWAQVININLSGVFYGMKYQIAAMLASGGGSIVNISSISALRPRGLTTYTTSKAAVIGLTQAMAVDHGRDHIRVNCICPGPVYTPMVYARGNGMSEAARAQRARASVLKTEGTGWDVGHAVRFLLSSHARYITGQVLVVDGGVTLQGPERDSQDH